MSYYPTLHVGNIILIVLLFAIFIGLFVLSIVALVLLIRFLIVAVRVMTTYERKHLSGAAPMGETDAP